MKSFQRGVVTLTQNASSTTVNLQTTIDPDKATVHLEATGGVARYGGGGMTEVHVEDLTATSFKLITNYGKLDGTKLGWSVIEYN